MNWVSAFLCIKRLCDYYSICCLQDMVAKKVDHLDSLYPCRLIFQAWHFSTARSSIAELFGLSVYEKNQLLCSNLMLFVNALPSFQCIVSCLCSHVL